MMQITWKEKEFENLERDLSWYVLIIVIAALIALLALWQKNFLFFIFVIIATTMIIVLGHRQARVFEFILSKDGLDIEKRHHPLSSFKSFSIYENSLIFKRKGHFHPHLIVKIPENKVDEVRSLLLDFLPEIEYDESLTDALSRFLRL